MWLIAMKVSMASLRRDNARRLYRSSRLRSRAAHEFRLIPEWGGLALGRRRFGSPSPLSVSDVNAGAPEPQLDERDAFGLRAGQKGRALANGQRLLQSSALVGSEQIARAMASIRGA
jgi:hypothetical protein